MQVVESLWARENNSLKWNLILRCFTAILFKLFVTVVLSKELGAMNEGNLKVEVVWLRSPPNSRVLNLEVFGVDTVHKHV